MQICFLIKIVHQTAHLEPRPLVLLHSPKFQLLLPNWLKFCDKKRKRIRLQQLMMAHTSEESVNKLAVFISSGTGSFKKCLNYTITWGISSIPLTRINSSFISSMTFLRLFLNEMKLWTIDRDWLLIAAQFSVVNRLFSEQLLFSAISNSTGSFSSFPCRPSSSIS